MNLQFFADPHIGNHKRFGGYTVAGINTRCAETLSVLRQAIQPDKYNIILGDLFDVSRPWPQIIAAVQAIILDKTPTDSSQRQCIILTGNHDADSTQAGDHALAALAPIATIVDKPEVLRREDKEIVCIPYVGNNLRNIVKEFLESLKPPDKNIQRVLAMHAGLIHKDTPPYLKDSQTAIPFDDLAQYCKKAEIDFVFAGDWHDFKYLVSNGVQAWQVGTLCPTGWDNPGVLGFGKVLTLDTTKKHPIREQEIKGPRFVTASTPQEVEAAYEEQQNGYKIYLRLKAKASEAQETIALVKTLGIENVEVIIDASIGKQEARQAAKAAASSDTLSEAIDAYIAAMPAMENREAVREQVRKFLKI